ncbi:MAG: HlyD family efflux transporter periplasmic adaptor subunit [Gammaproteobacteria bacterium]
MNVVLPLLREELDLFSGTPAIDGSPTWQLHDPVRNLFFNVDWLSFEILSRWHLRDAMRIADSIELDTPLQIDESDVERVAYFLIENQLIQIQDATAVDRLVNTFFTRKSSVWRGLLHHYLFFRIPLVRPDRWLSRTVELVSPFYSKYFLGLTLIVLVIGLSQCYRQGGQFLSTLVDMFTLKGMFSYGMTLILVKILHELGHAFTAKRKGCRVPTMGIAFLVMWPVAYTDVNEAWKLKNKADRLAIGAAGVLTELAIAAWATFAWGFLPDGMLKEIAFLLATTTWISTVLINASPFMRFDGYFLLSDYWEIPNLHNRSFALARWHLREILFKLNEPAPELFSHEKLRTLIIFAWIVWLYRFILFLGIALLVYHFFFKILGIFLFMVEIGFFIMLPIWREVRAWSQRFDNIRDSKRTKITLTLLFVLFLLGIVPWHSQITGIGMLRTAEYYPIYSPGPAQVIAVNHQAGEQIESGESLFLLESPELNYHEQRADEHAKTLRRLLEFSGLDETLRLRQGITREELAGAETEYQGYQREKKRYAIKAPFSGTLVDTAIDLKQGIWVNRQDRLGVLINPERWQVQVYLGEQAVHRVKVSDVAHFYPETPGSKPFRLRVVRIDPDATHVLSEPMLSVATGGPWMVRERNGQLMPEKAIYRVTLEVVEGEAPGKLQTMRGKVVIQGAAQSFLGDYLKSALAVLIRESGM